MSKERERTDREADVLCNGPDNGMAELRAKRKRNAALAAKIHQIETELTELKKMNAKVVEERIHFERKYEAIRQSHLWRMAKRAVDILRKLREILTGKRKEKLRKQARKRINKIKYRLNELGFDQAVNELRKIIEDSSNPYLRKRAAWELALWYANQYNKSDARRCLELLPKAVKGESEPQFLRKVAVIKAECLARMGDHKKAKRVIEKTLKSSDHSDLFLAAANLESSLARRLEWINKALARHGLSEVTLRPETGHFINQPVYDRLVSGRESVRSAIEQNGEATDDGPKVTVIIPAYNAANVIRTSLESILAQTWTNLEIIVIDDCSQDETAKIVESYAQKDPRIHLVRAASNAGPYVARNLALDQATGEFVTVNDADDWSHPEKIARQARHLLQHPAVIANASEQARATESLEFYRRGKPGEYIFVNMSSLMFRRKPVMETLGYWDSVRFGADGEFKRRLEKVFGADAVVDLKTGPLSFQRQTSASLTGDGTFGFHGYFMGARKEYFDSYTYYHQRGTTFKYEFPQEVRPFPVPEPMKPKRENSLSGRRHFDVIIVSEFRLLGGTNMSNAEEIKAQKKMGLRTGLIQMSRYDFDSQKRINPKIRELIDGQQVQMIVYGEKVSCDLLIVRHPPILQEWQRYIPNVEAGHIHVIINQPPQRDYSRDGEVLYDIPRCANNLKKYFGSAGIWHPIGPSIRSVLEEHHSEDLRSIQLSDEDWVNIIHVDDWRRPSRPTREGSKICIGRHSRPQYVKWPNDPDELLAIYPDTHDVEVLILGGAQIPKKVIGYIPNNWLVYEFDEIHPKDFLAALDVFVYYTYPDWVESFGRVIFEAMAVGVPVIIPPVYRPLFGEAAIYAEPDEVQEKIQQLIHGDGYQNQVRKAHDYVEEHFGYSKHVSRLEGILDRTVIDPKEKGGHDDEHSQTNA